MNNRIPICFYSNNDRVAKLLKTMGSIIKNKTSNDELYFYIITDFIDDINKRAIFNCISGRNAHLKFIYTDKDLFLSFNIPYFCNKEEKVLYIPDEICISTSLEKLFKTNLKNSYIGIVRDKSRKLNEDENIIQFINSGILLFNAEKWRNEKLNIKNILRTKAFEKNVKFLNKWSINKRNKLTYKN